MQFLTLVVVFFYVAWQNFFLSEKWWQLNLRSIDDLATNTSTELMRTAILLGDWERVISFFDYAYGAGFWALMTVLTIPAYIFESQQLQILIGRNSSLVAVFCTSFVVALIGRKIYPEGRHLWLAAVGVSFITPISLINATKMHVNGWATLLGALSIFFLIKQERLTKKNLTIGAVLIGMSVGFKLTAAILLPLFMALALQGRRKKIFKDLVFLTPIIIFSFIAASAPIIFKSPFNPSDAKKIADTISFFRKLGGGADISTASLLNPSLEFYGFSLILGVLLFLLILLGLNPHQNSNSSLKKIFALGVASTYSIAWIMGALIIDKGSIYLATYLLSISVFLPIGIFGLSRVFLGTRIQLLFGWSLCVANVLLNPHFNSIVMKNYNFYELNKSSEIERKLEAAEDIERLIIDIPRDTRVLLDSSSVFPRSNIEGTVIITINYGSLAEYVSLEELNHFDFIALDSSSYYGQPNISEEKLRNELKLLGNLGSASYDLIYSENGTEVYKLNVGQNK